MAEQSALPGMEAGRRAERGEWGLRYTSDNTPLGTRGHVQPRVSEAHARHITDMTPVERRHLGYGNVEVVRRTVVTYTTDWEPAPVSTVPPPIDVLAVLAKNGDPGEGLF